MSAVRDSWTVVAAVFRRDMRTMLSYRARFGTQILSVFFSLTLFYYISRLVHISTFATADAYYGYAVVGLVVLQVLNSTLQTPPTTLRQELVAGSFERIVVSPAGPVAALLGMLIFPFLYTLVLAMVMVLFSGTVFGLGLQWSAAPLAIPVAMLAGIAFAPFGVLLLALVLTYKQAVSGTTWIVAGISLIAGLYFPVALLPDWIQWASDVQPFTPATELLRHLLVDTPLKHPAWLDVLKLIGFAGVLMPAAVWVASRAVERARRTGTIIEY